MTAFHLGENLFLRVIDALTAAEAAAWDHLQATHSGVQQAFLSRAYASAVAQSGRKVVVVVAYVAQAPAFFLPLQRQGGVLGWCGLHEPAGDVMTDYFGAVAAPGTQVDIEALLEATRGAINAVFFTHLDETQAAHGLAAHEHRTGLRTHLGSPPQDYWVNLRKTDKKLVYDTERREKKLATDHGSLSFEWASVRPDHDLQWLIESKKSQYSRTGKEQAPLFQAPNAQLLRSLLTSVDARCTGLLSVLRCGDRIVAAHFGLRSGDMLHVWFPVYDPQFASYSPGRILFKFMFLAAADQGVLVFDRGEGDNQAKRDFANQEHRFGRGVWRAPTWRGRLCLLALRLRWRLAQGLA